MDPGVAAVLGAVIALIGAIGAPWIREVVTRRSVDRREREVAIRTLVVAHLEAVIRAHEVGLPPGKRSNRILAAHVTGVRLAALLNADEAVIEYIGEEAIALTPNLNSGEEGVRLASLALVTAYQMTVLAWIRGAIKTRAVRETYNQWCATLAAMPPNDPFKPAATRPVE
ncbi:hypothetical protein [Microbacterium resistens]|uniref:hypothetical protein n=1 Tax=Microbacterium resistens TaxID=156977 RepID=UPI00366C4E68